MDVVKVLLIDDEIMPINFITKLVDWQRAGFVIIGHALAAVKGVSMAEKLRPDVVFTDIRMPGMDGLAVCSRILKNNPACRVILLTAYRDFEYARQAIQAGAYDYVVKHELTASSLMLLLEKIKDSLEAVKSREAEQARTSLHSLLLDNSVKPEALKALRKNHNRFALVFLAPDLPLRLYREYAPPAMHCLNEREFSGTEWAILGSAEMENGGVVYLFGANHFPAAGRYEYALIDTANWLQTQYLESRGITATVFVSRIKADLQGLSAIWAEYTRLRQAIRYHRGQIVTHAECAEFLMSKQAPDITEALPSELEAALSHYQARDAVELLKKYLVAPYAGKKLLGLHIHDLCTVLDVIDRFRQRMGFASYRAIYHTEGIDWAHWVSLHDFVEWLANQVETLVCHGVQAMSAKSSFKVTQAITYMETHFSSNIGLSEIAGALEISQGHLSKIFKEHMGKTVGQYLQELRLEQAKRLIAARRYKINEVSGMCGFQTSQYFSQVFRREFGVTPQEYAWGQGGGLPS